jgi:general stress protein 26
MSSPETTLDQRFSNEGAAPVPWDQTREILQAAEMFWISTVRADGRPHVTPLVAVWVDDAIHFHTGPQEQKSVNLRANPHVVLTTGCNQWDRGIDVMVEGDAVPVTDGDVLKRLAEAWGAKWDGQWQLAVGEGGFRNPDMNDFESLVFTVRPAKVFAQAKGDPFSQTRYVF